MGVRTGLPRPVPGRTSRSEGPTLSTQGGFHRGGPSRAPATCPGRRTNCPEGPACRGPASSVPSPALPHLFPKASQHPVCRQSPRSQLLGPPSPPLHRPLSPGPALSRGRSPPTPGPSFRPAEAPAQLRAQNPEESAVISAASSLAFYCPSPSLACCGWMGSIVCVLSSLSGSGAPLSVTNREGSSELTHTLSSRPGGGQHSGLVLHRPAGWPAGDSPGHPSPWVLRTAPGSRAPHLPPRWCI